MAIKQLSDGEMQQAQERSGPDDRDLIIKGLRVQLADAEESSRADRIKLAQVEGGVRTLRSILAPLYSALKDVFGEMNAMGVAEVSATPGSVVPAQSNAKWESWKRRMPGRPSEIIDLLLIHESMNTKQLSAALRCDPRTTAQVIYALNKASLLTKNGNNFSLKEI
jgi:hypothetical protein